MDRIASDVTKSDERPDLTWLSPSLAPGRTTVRSRYKAPTLRAGADAAFARLDDRYRRLQELSRPLALTSAALGLVSIVLRAFAPAAVSLTAWVWVALLAVAAAWHLLPPAFAAPDLYRRVARSIEPLTPASEWNEQVLRMTRFALVVASTWVLVANDLLREAKLKFYDSVALVDSSPQALAAVESARNSTESTWTNVSLLVLGAAVSIGIGRRLHAVDVASQPNCQMLCNRPQRGACLHIVLTAVALAVLAGAAHLTSRLIG